MAKAKVNDAVKEPDAKSVPAQTLPENVPKKTTAEAAKETITAQVVVSATVFVAVNYPQSVKFTVPDKNGLPCDLVLNGNATELRGKEMGILPIGAYGVTEVDADAWTYIKRQYAGLPLIKNGLIFAVEKDERYARDAAAERKGERNGFEPIDPNRTNTKPDDGKNI